MHALVTTLPEPYYSQVESIWDNLEEKYNLKGIRITPIPHFSWQVADAYPEEEILKMMDAIASETRPFDARIKGIDFFIGQNPVIFLKVLKDQNLIKLHLKIWKEFFFTAKGPSLLYSPPLWRPHISLTYQDLTWKSMKEIYSYLKAQDFNWEFEVNNLALVCQAGDAVGKLKYQVQLTG